LAPPGRRSEVDGFVCATELGYGGAQLPTVEEQNLRRDAYNRYVALLATLNTPLHEPEPTPTTVNQSGSSGSGGGSGGGHAGQVRYDDGGSGVPRLDIQHDHTSGPIVGRERADATEHPNKRRPGVGSGDVWDRMRDQRYMDQGFDESSPLRRRPNRGASPAIAAAADALAASSGIHTGGGGSGGTGTSSSIGATTGTSGTSTVGTTMSGTSSTSGAAGVAMHTVPIDDNQQATLPPSAAALGIGDNAMGSRIHNVSPRSHLVAQRSGGSGISNATRGAVQAAVAAAALANARSFTSAGDHVHRGMAVGMTVSDITN
jgi:hypothetical protein